MTSRATVDDASRAVRGRSGHAIALGALLAVFGALFSGCGQRGPLTLPDSARPVERLDPAAAPAEPVVPPATGAEPPAQPEPESEDDGSQNGARRPENER